jgi:catechol 2,3-dioxygenase-like lactoylglutathione lyase family enzyme
MMERVRASQGILPLLLALFCLLVVAFAASARPLAAGGPVSAVDSVTIPVSDMDRALDFYEDVLSFEKVRDVEVTGEAYEHLMGLFGLRMRIVRMRLGDEFIELMEVLTPKGRPIPALSRSNDAWFQHVAIITPDMERAFDWLRRHDVTYASPAPQRLPDWNPAAGGIEAFYFKDPDGNNLEILQFPEGKGDPKWHDARGDELFLGIDHTAIVVGDTDASLAFWRDRLGFEVAGESENWGPEQERLNNVFGARLRITALRAPRGPGVEFLEYLTPRDGRPFPADTRASDLWHWQVNVTTAEAEAAAGILRDAQARFISPGPVDVPDEEAGFDAGLMARDPDGHALMLRQQ